MEIDKENVRNGIKRKRPWALEGYELLPTSSANNDRPRELVVTSMNKSDEGGYEADELENQNLDLELLPKSDGEIEDTIERIRKCLHEIGDMLPDRGDRLKANLRRNEIELERRKKLESEKENQKEEFELEEKTDQEIEDAIARIRKFLQVLADKLPDKGERLKANLRRNEIELERRKKLKSDKKYSTTASPECLGGIEPAESQGSC